ncbi:magnesium and cobalt transport protein CorA [Orrella sp. NBD-18]|uniref:Magnesium and cobalt transport protein CorA n=1 Tax=Sheuella amnicola TaxID=2707330 RepID=A0A6B2QYB9_9BURK|nr:magnesium and cobalt transport protein CorA [Sheuella amnicola]HBI82606.1 magnesium transporter [Alcaligenaceae bacterium]
MEHSLTATPQNRDSRRQASGETPTLVASRVYIKGKQARDVPVDELARVAGEPDHLLWVGLKEPDAVMVGEVARQLGLDSHVVEDLQAKHRLPKVMDYDSVVLVVAMTIEVGASDGLPVYGETQMLIGRNFLLTIRRGAVAPHTELRRRLESMPDKLARGSDFIAAELIDLLIDRYNVAYDVFEKAVGNMEHSLIVRGLEGLHIKRLYQMRRDFQKMHSSIAPLGEVCRRLGHLDFTPISAAARSHFNDLSDRVSRVDRLFDNLGSGLAFAFEAGMLIEQSKQTDTTRRLAAWAAILAVPTAIAGIYGMNFENIPELKWKYGFWVITGLMTSVCGYLYYRFRKAKWL